MMWKRMSSTEASKQIADIEKKSADDFYSLVNEWKDGNFSESIDVEYSEIRSKIFEVYSGCKDQSGYEIDMKVGLALYELF